MQKEKLLMIPGPSPVHPRIINSLSLPTVSHASPVLLEELKEALADLKKIVFWRERRAVHCGWSWDISHGNGHF